MKKFAGFIIFTIVVIFLLIGGVFVSSYNNLQVLDEDINANWAQVENQLKRRNDLIPNFVATVKGYATHEKEVFTKVAEARSKLAGSLSTKDVKAIGKDEKGLNSAMSRLLMIVERYPDLKANKSFIALQDELAGTENRLAVARRDYNESVKKLNALIRTVPTIIVATISGVKAREYFEVSEVEKAAPKVEF